MCESNSVEQDEHPESRIDYAISIDKLIEKLQAAGVDIHGSGVKFAVVVGHDYEQAGVCVPFMRLIENPNSHSDG
ncbi:hypothetical protein FACS1894184_20840 [Clostridia bacterium]|nr:hypothetical protein FACS1894184_20840 [Clostridia bacterium]